MAMPDLINWELMANPLNWVMVILMLSIGVFALHFVMHNAGQLSWPLTANLGG